MDKNIQIQLGNTKNINSVNVDNFEKVELSLTPSLLTEYNVRNAVSAADIFDEERNTTAIYRIYGGFEYFSMLNGLDRNYNSVVDFFTPNSTTNVRDVFNSFDFYLVKPADTGYTSINYSSSTTTELNIDYKVFETFRTSRGFYTDGDNGDIPNGWDSYATGAYASWEEHYNADTGTNSGMLKYTLNTYVRREVTNPGYIGIFKEFLDEPLFGQLIIETYVDGANLEANDYLNIEFKDSTGRDIVVFNTLENGTGTKRYTANISASNPVYRIDIQGRASDATMWMDKIVVFTSDGTVTNVYSFDGYHRNFEIIASPNEFELFKAGFSKNVFNEQKYIFTFNNDIDISDYFDALGFPVTEVFLYARYKPISSANGLETYQYTYWDEETGQSELRNMTPQTDNFVYGDLISYQKKIFKQEQVEEQIHYISTPVAEGTLVWKYNPLIPIRLQYLSSEVSKANSGSTSYEQTQLIPDYATRINDNNDFVWREILPQGYIDPLTGNGVDYPFVNKRRYLSTNIQLSITPDLTNRYTNGVFRDLNFKLNAYKTKAIGDLDDLGKPCQ